MSRKGNRGFADTLTAGLDEEVEAAKEAEGQTPARGVMDSRSDALGKLASGKIVRDRTEFVDPQRCRPWRLHNRDLDHLTEESCRDLIDAFLSAKKQRIPAIVRRLRDDPDHDYEIIAGVRRWWVVKWLREHHHQEFDYLVTVQTLADEEAFRVSDIENRSRQDITDWERAKEYEVALAEFYEGSQTTMADFLNISPAWLTRILSVARLPDSIVDAFADPHHITTNIAKKLKPLCKDKGKLARMEAEAQKIISEKGGEGGPLSGVETQNRLVKAAQGLSDDGPKPAPEVIKSSKGKAMIKVTRPAKGGAFTIKILDKSGATKEEQLAAIEKLL